MPLSWHQWSRGWGCDRTDSRHSLTWRPLRYYQTVHPLLPRCTSGSISQHRCLIEPLLDLLTPPSLFITIRFVSHYLSYYLPVISYFGYPDRFFRVFFLSCKVNARVYNVKAGHGLSRIHQCACQHSTCFRLTTAPVWAQTWDSHPTKVYRPNK
jgi:hypothetical protein